MKSLVFIFVTFFLLSCNLSKEDAAESLIAKAVKNNLVLPDSYDPIETKLDSAFSPIDDPELIDICVKTGEIAGDMLQYEHEKETSQSQMAIFASRSSEFERNEYRQAKEKYDNATRMLERYGKEIESMVQSKAAKIDTTRKFIGYKATHSYRAKNNAGQVVINKSFFYFDKDIKRITAQLDEDSYAYVTYKQLLYGSAGSR